MAQIPGSNVSAPVVPNDTADVYPSHLARYGQGGWHTGAATVAGRDAIPVERREWGMVVSLPDGTKWELKQGAASQNLSDNGNWQAFSVSGGGSGSGSAGRGTYLSLPGRYSAANRTHALPAGTQDIDLKWGSGRELEPGQDYTLDTATDPPTVTITASLDAYEGERVWGRTYRSSSRTYLALPTRYGPGYQPVELPAGTADVGVFWGSGRELEPGIGYTFDDTTRLLTITANTDMFGGERIWLWLYS